MTSSPLYKATRAAQRSTRSAWASVGFIALALVVVTTVFGPARVAWSDDVDKLFEQGNAAMKKGDYKTAYEKLSKAWELRQTFDIAANLAQAEEEVGRKSDAANHLAFALAHFPPSQSDKSKATLQAMLDKLRPGLVELAITTDEGATVTVDGTKIGVAPLAFPAFVEPGEHTFSAEKGSWKGSVKLTFAAGKKERVMIKLTPSASAWDLPSASSSGAPSATAAPSSSAPPPPDDGPPKWPGFVVGGIGLVGVAIGGGLIGAGTAAKSDAETTGAALDGQCRAGDATGACGDLAKDLESANTLRNAGLGTTIAGGAVFVAGLATLIWSFTADSPAADEARVQLVPVFGQEAQGLWIHLTY